MIMPAQREQTKTTFPDASAIRQLARAGLIVVLLWTVSSKVYYALSSSVGGYDDMPLAFAAYYVGWAILAFFFLRSCTAQPLDSGTVQREAVALLPILVGFGAFVVFVLPLLPEVSRLRAPPDPPAFMFASAWYYLPKSADILFQQALVAALIFTAVRVGLGLWPISIGMAGAFGLFHLALAFDGFTALYVARFTLAAAVFGALLPWLYLRVRSGFRWAYALHGGFYAADATLTHLILAAPPWAQT